MDSISEFSDLIANRENLYRLLMRLYRAEVDKELWDWMRYVDFPTECGEAELDEGYRMLGAFFRNPGSDPLTDLAVDYARIFLGAGVYDGVVASPYESVYTSKERLIMQDARDSVLALYRANGLDAVEALDVPEDHIALEFEFMAHLCRRTQSAVAARDWAAISACLEEQRKFLKQHLENWIYEFCADIAKCAATEFYKAVARITCGYLSMESAIIEDLISNAAVSQK